MKYRDLAQLLQRLEIDWRLRSVPPNPSRYPSHLRVRANDNLQFFALSDEWTRETDPARMEEDRPIVVAVGVNYTQDPSEIPDQTYGRKPNPRHACSFPHLVEDKVNDYERTYLEACNRDRATWVNGALCSPHLPLNLLQDNEGKIRPYHLIMTNLTPWITTKRWSGIQNQDGPAITGELLDAAPVHTLRQFAHIYALKKKLKEAGEMPVVWIGHSKDSVWEFFRGLVRQMQVEDWMLTPNLARHPDSYKRSGGFLRQAEVFEREYLAKATPPLGSTLPLPSALH